MVSQEDWLKAEAKRIELREEREVKSKDITLLVERIITGLVISACVMWLTTIAYLVLT